MGRPVGRSWFRKVSKELFQKCYPSRNLEEVQVKFSNGWFWGYLEWHQISLRSITNTASQLFKDFWGAILLWR